MTTYPWEAACLRAVLETDNGLVYSRIIAARSIIAERLYDREAISEDEQIEIENALKGLGILESERVIKTNNEN